ncbi:MAG: DUF4908 domain-containing protein [Pseudomonadota bacterium]|nr:DUF4908 domain-containing protein [Pseudomonadota bacterium]
MSAWGIPGLLLVLSLTAGAGPAAAQAAGLRNGAAGARPFSGRTTIAPPVAKYVAGDDRAFVLDRSGQTPLLKFEDSAEVWVLRPAPGPRGDVIYKDELGRQVIRASRVGGLTVFTADNPRGLPAALAGRASAIRLTVIRPDALLSHFVAQSRRASRAVRRRILFETGEDATAATAILFADAATIAAEAVARFAERADARSVLSRLDTVRVTLGWRPGAVVRGDTLEVVIAPQLGLSGRPSSERIVRALDAAG